MRNINSKTPEACTQIRKSCADRGVPFRKLKYISGWPKAQRLFAFRRFYKGLSNPRAVQRKGSHKHVLTSAP